MAATPRYVSSSTALNGARWRRSSHSTGANNCVEAAAVANGRLAVRDSKAAEGPALLFRPAAWAAFVAGVKRGEFQGRSRRAGPPSGP